MKTETRTNLTDDRWVGRIGQLRQEVSDQYNPADGTADEWVNWTDVGTMAHLVELLREAKAFVRGEEE